MTTYLTTTIPYVNAPPHLGFALEAVQADVLARHARARGESVRLLSGTDDNSLKNVLAAEAAGLPHWRRTCRCVTTTSSVPASTRVTASASRRCGGPAPATCTRTPTKASTASAASTT
jgi:tRNA synthetases class I (M)